MQVMAIMHVVQIIKKKKKEKVVYINTTGITFKSSLIYCHIYKKHSTTYTEICSLHLKVLSQYLCIEFI